MKVNTVIDLMNIKLVRLLCYSVLLVLCNKECINVDNNKTFILLLNSFKCACCFMYRLCDIFHYGAGWAGMLLVLQ